MDLRRATRRLYGPPRPRHHARLLHPPVWLLDTSGGSGRRPRVSHDVAGTPETLRRGPCGTRVSPGRSTGELPTGGRRRYYYLVRPTHRAPGSTNARGCANPASAIIALGERGPSRAPLHATRTAQRRRVLHHPDLLHTSAGPAVFGAAYATRGLRFFAKKHLCSSTLTAARDLRPPPQLKNRCPAVLSQSAGVAATRGLRSTPSPAPSSPTLEYGRS